MAPHLSSLNRWHLPRGWQCSCRRPNGISPAIFGVLSSHAAACSQVVPSAERAAVLAAKDKHTGKSRYIPWAELLRQTFGFEILCSKCQAQLRLIELVKTEDIAKKILTAMHLPTEIPELHPARPPPGEKGGEDWVN